MKNYKTIYFIENGDKRLQYKSGINKILAMIGYRLEENNNVGMIMKNNAIGVVYDFENINTMKYYYYTDKLTYDNLAFRY
jgi:hypothetical protein